jgi:hypothetical protein
MALNLLILSPLKSIRANGVLGFALGVLFFRGLHWEFVVFGGCCFFGFYWFCCKVSYLVYFVGLSIGFLCMLEALRAFCVLRLVYFVGLSIGFLCMLEALCAFCVLRGALRFLIYITLLIKKTSNLG